MRFAHGRWNREQRHSVEVVNDGGASWGACSCGWQGPLRTGPGEADTDADGHERAVHAVHKAGGRIVRGRIE